jgi:hypothetical protein
MCGTTSVSAYEAALGNRWPSYLTVSTSTGVPVLTFYTQSGDWVAKRTLTVVYTLSSNSKFT